MTPLMRSTLLMILALTPVLTALAAPESAEIDQLLQQLASERLAERHVLLGNDPATQAVFIEAFLAGLHERGWEDGRTVAIEYRWSRGDPELSRRHAAELIGIPVDVIFAPNSALADVAHRATATIPIVFALSPDPVGFGHVKSLARPGGNITGLSNIVAEVSASWTARCRSTAAWA